MTRIDLKMKSSKELRTLRNLIRKELDFRADIGQELEDGGGIKEWVSAAEYSARIQKEKEKKERNKREDEYIRRIIDALGHELIHRGQARKRRYKQQRGYKGPGKDKAERKYLGHPDELEAHAYNIAQELLHKHDKDTIIDAFRKGDLNILKDSPNWQAYLYSFETSDDPIIRKLIKFIVKYIDRLDKRNI